MPAQLWAAPWGPPGAGDGPSVTAATLTDATPQPWKQAPMSTFQVGTRLWFRAQGDITSTSATPTAQLGFYLGTPGSIATATPIAVSVAMPISASAAAFPWFLDYFAEVRSLGSAGTIHGMGYVTWGGNSGLATDMPQYPFPVTAAARLVTVNMFPASPQFLMIGSTLSSTTGAPAVVCRHVYAEQGA